MSSGLAGDDLAPGKPDAPARLPAREETLPSTTASACVSVRSPLPFIAAAIYARCVPDRLSNPRMLFGLPILLFIFVLANFLALNKKSITVDEPVHLSYGLSLLRGEAGRVSDSTMPFSVLNAIPYAAVENLTSGETKWGWRLSRSVTLGFSAFVALIVCLWSGRLYGSRAAILAALLYVLCPNIQAHSRWVTTDLFRTGMILIALARIMQEI